MRLWTRLFGRRKQGPDAAQPDNSVERHINADGTVRLTTVGIVERGSKELQIDGTPADLVSEAMDLLKRLGDLAARENFQRDGETLGGPLLHEAQPVIHAATLRLASRTTEPGADELFRVVDYQEPVNAGFPARLMATHLALVAESEPTRRRIQLLRRSVALFPGEAARFDSTFAFERGENVGNWLGWSLLGETLIEAGSIEEGLSALERAVLRCPAWADDFARHVAESVRRTGTDPREDPRLQFWIKYAELPR